MVRILHILPALTIGGVEVGVQLSAPELRERFDYEVFSIKGPGEVDVVPVRARALIPRFLLRRRRPDVVVTSLWPSHPLGFALERLGVAWVPFFHSAAKEGVPRDQVLTFAARRARTYLCDSPATAAFFGLSDHPGLFICPYVFYRMAAPDDEIKNRPYRFIYCGRIAHEKRLDLILKFLSIAQAQAPDSEALMLLGASDNAFNELKVEVARLDLRVTLLQNVSAHEVPSYFRQSEFYLNLSDYEGFSMTTVEALQCGCVPVVRPVGEIPRYVGRQSGVIVDTPSTENMAAAAEQCMALHALPEERAAMVARAMTELRQYDDYVSAFSRAIDYALNRT